MMLEILENQLNERLKVTKREEQAFEKIFSDPRLGVVRRTLGKKVFLKFMEVYSEGMRHTVTEE